MKAAKAPAIQMSSWENSTQHIYRVQGRARRRTFLFSDMSRQLTRPDAVACLWAVDQINVSFRSGFGGRSMTTGERALSQSAFRPVLTRPYLHHHSHVGEKNRPWSYWVTVAFASRICLQRTWDHEAERQAPQQDGTMSRIRNGESDNHIESPTKSVILIATFTPNNARVRAVICLSQVELSCSQGRLGSPGFPDCSSTSPRRHLPPHCQPEYLPCARLHAAMHHQGSPGAGYSPAGPTYRLLSKMASQQYHCARVQSFPATPSLPAVQTPVP